MTSVKYVRAETLIDCLTKACELGEISRDDQVIDAEMIDDDFALGGREENVPAGSLRLLFRSADPDAKMDTEIIFLQRTKKEETQE